MYEPPTQAERASMRQAGVDLMRKAGEEGNKAAERALQAMQKPTPEQIRANEENSRRPPSY